MTAIRFVIISLVAAAVLQPMAAYADVAPVPLELSRGQARAIMLAALAGLAILGFGMVALIWLGARFTQRYRRGTATPEPTKRPTEHDWAKEPLANGSDSLNPEP